MSWQRNPGHCPDEAAGRRVRVIFANGIHGDVAGWAADGPRGLRWSRQGEPFDIERFEVVK